MASKQGYTQLNDPYKNTNSQAQHTVQITTHNTNQYTQTEWPINKTQYKQTPGHWGAYTEGNIYGELITYAPEANRFKNPFAWIQFIALLWDLGWAVIFTLFSSGTFTFAHLWAALLTYILGTVVVKILGQAGGFWWYLTRNDLSTAFHHPHYYGSTSHSDNHYMSLAHTKELVIGGLASILTSIFIIWQWWDWLCKFKNECNMTTADKSTLFPIVANTAEYTIFNGIFTAALVLSVISIFFLIRSMLAHWRPLRAITHLINGVPVGPTHLTNYHGHQGTHGGVVHTQTVKENEGVNTPVVTITTQANSQFTNSSSSQNNAVEMETKKNDTIDDDF